VGHAETASVNASIVEIEEIEGNATEEIAEIEEIEEIVIEKIGRGGQTDLALHGNRRLHLRRWQNLPPIGERRQTREKIFVLTRMMRRQQRESWRKAESAEQP